MALKPEIFVGPTSGAIGIPNGLKEAGQRVDFKPDQFDLAIETKGYRIAWSRSAQCPCTSVNKQTDQPDPNCSLCKGNGWIYFAPSESISEVLSGSLDHIQQALIAKDNSVIIRGVMSNGSKDSDPYNQIVNWEKGEMMLTVRALNKLGYYDKIINLDSEIVYSELTNTDGSGILPLRYLATGVNLLRSLTTVYDAAKDYDDLDGIITWRTGKEPVKGTQVVAHYLMHPTWLVVRHPHVLRTTPVKFKIKTPTTPQGNPRPLPVQAIVQLDFLIGA